MYNGIDPIATFFIRFLCGIPGAPARGTPAGLPNPHLLRAPNKPEPIAWPGLYGLALISNLLIAKPE